MVQASTYQEAVTITQDYLGPAAERFIQRQISFRLHKVPEELTKDDIPQLIEWVKISITLLTDDKKMIDDFTRRIVGLMESNGRAA